LSGHKAEAGETRLVDVALRQAARLARLVGDPVDMRRMQNGRFAIDRQHFRLDEIVARAVEAAQLLNEQVGIHLQIADAPLVVDGDPVRIEQVVLILVANAVTHASGKASVNVRLRRSNGNAELQVEDHGLGIPPVDLPHVFSRFYQVQTTDQSAQPGLGLGLYIAKEIVEAHGGAIDVASAQGQGQGTTFTVQLPPAERAPSPRR
jgi:two-component system CheB/CheR fusion protein